MSAGLLRPDGIDLPRPGVHIDVFGLDDENADESFEDASSVDSDTLRAFIIAAVYANVAVLLVSLGSMGWFFQGWSRVGPALFLGGLLAGARSYWTYRSWNRSRDTVESDSGSDADGNGTDADDGGADADDDETDADDDRADFDRDADVSPPEA